MISLSKKVLLLSAIAAFSIYNFSSAQSSITPDPAYTKMISGRADKIVKALKLTDSLKAKRVSKLVAMQYSNLNDIYTIRDNKIKEVKAQDNADKKVTDAAIKTYQDQAIADIDKLHPKYLTSLSKELNSEQVTAIKDGMTYNVANITYNGYLDEVLTLTEAQKAQIKAWLVEAREHAMDAESSEKKHAWFGKYKGRINNYLSAAGIDMKKAGEEWQQRIKEKAGNKTDKSQ